jgi:hypothetical protein
VLLYLLFLLLTGLSWSDAETVKRREKRRLTTPGGNAATMALKMAKRATKEPAPNMRGRLRPTESRMKTMKLDA